MTTMGTGEGSMENAWTMQNMIDPSMPQSTASSLPAASESAKGSSVSSMSTPELETRIDRFASLERDFIDDLPKYIPVGVVGKELASTEEYMSRLQLLSQHHWIGVSASDIAMGLRIYVNTTLTHRLNSQRSVTRLREALKFVISKMDPSSDVWEGYRNPQEQSQDFIPAAEEESLWYIYNTLQNPAPNVGAMKDPWARRAMEEVLSGGDFTEFGLKTDLFPYQRRSAAMMIQRESQPALMLDPRLQILKTPLGLPYYYDKEEGCIFREKAVYSEACGGILAETMGGGKTLISLAVIWATRGHVPKIPIQYQSPQDRPNSIPVREKTGSLLQMAAAAAGRHSKPWKSFFLDKKQQDDLVYKRCIEACEFNAGSYEIPPPPSRYQGRHGTSYPRPPAKRIRLCSGTLAIVPKNLVDHWESEIAKHTEGLKVLVLRNSNQKTPSASDLLDYDIVLFDRQRFEKEAGEPRHSLNFKWNQIDSPLTELHWLRVIVDEGHNVAGNGGKTKMGHLLSKLHIERRWVISGTPSVGLYGVEISLASQEAGTIEGESPEKATAAALNARNKTGSAINNEMKTLNQLRGIVIDFLDLKPWSNSKGDDPADWTRYMKPIGENGNRRKSLAIRATLQGLVVRHQLDVVHQENILPPLYNKPVYLEPTFYDKLSINLFIFGLAVNAITSERQGKDYMFDSSNRKDLNLLISNLRQAGFWWVGSNVNLEDSIEHATKYMDKNLSTMTQADVEKLKQGMEIAYRALGSSGWNHFKHMQELGIHLLNFPRDHQSHWALSPDGADDNPLLIGITQARRAQQYVTENLRSLDPAEGLSGRGIKVRKELSERDTKTKPRKASSESSNIPATVDQLHHSPKPSTFKSPKKTFDHNLSRPLPKESPLMKTQFVATASAKLTYLLDQVIKYQESEKIIIFYENDNTAYWIAEGLEVLGIEFRIYASSLKPGQRTEYLRLFRETDKIRVLLMSLSQAAHGLHIAQASRVYIVNPIWQPTIESQAIKRAHRIGQTRPVYVETLVLCDTLEHRMLLRRKEMTEAEMQNAEKSLLDDNTMSDIIQNEPFLHMPEEFETGAAYLEHPTGFFDRHRLPIPDDEEVPAQALGISKRAISSTVDADTAEDTSPTPKKRKGIGFANQVQVFRPEETTEEPQLDIPRTPVRVTFPTSSLQSSSPSTEHSSLPQTDLASRAKRVSIFGP